MLCGSWCLPSVLLPSCLLAIFPRCSSNGDVLNSYFVESIYSFGSYKYVVVVYYIARPLERFGINVYARLNLYARACRILKAANRMLSCTYPPHRTHTMWMWTEQRTFDFVCHKSPACLPARHGVECFLFIHLRFSASHTLRMVIRYRLYFPHHQRRYKHRKKNETKRCLSIFLSHI